MRKGANGLEAKSIVPGMGSFDTRSLWPCVEDAESKTARACAMRLNCPRSRPPESLDAISTSTLPPGETNTEIISVVAFESSGDEAFHTIG